MTFLEIVNMVLSGSFDESKRSMAKEWVNARLGEALDSETWSFMRTSATVSVTAGSRVVGSIPTDFAIAHALIDGDGNTLTSYRDLTAFLQDYPPDSTDLGTPEAWAAASETLYAAPTAAASAADWTLVYERKHVALSADGDQPVIPPQYHVALSLAGKAYGMRVLGIPLWNEHEQAWQQALDTMRRKYLATVRAPGGVWS